MFDVEDLEELREDKFLVEAVLDREGAAVVEVEVLELETPAKSVDDMISEGKDTSMRRSSTTFNVHRESVHIMTRRIKLTGRSRIRTHARHISLGTTRSQP